MAKRGAPKGNTNAASRYPKIFGDLLRKVSVQEDHKRLKKGIEQLLNDVAEGDKFALGLVRDTFDGKPAQQIDLDASVDGSLSVEIVRFGDKNT